MRFSFFYFIKSIAILYFNFFYQYLPYKIFIPLMVSSEMRVYYCLLWHFLWHVLVFYATTTGTWQLPFACVCVRVCVDSIQFACALDDLSCRCACTYLCVCFRFFLPICISLLRLRQSSTKNCYRSRRRRRRCCYCCCDCVCIQSSMSFCILHISLGSSEGVSAAAAACCKHFVG